MKIHINKLRNLMKGFYRDIKDVSPPFTQEESEEFEDVFNIFLEKLKKEISLK